MTPPAATGPWTKTVLHTFTGGDSDGSRPYGDVTLYNGNLYGTTEYGGGTFCNIGSGCGTVYELVAPAMAGGAWTENILYDFDTTQGANGGAPITMVTFGPDGTLYGTTKHAGGGPCVQANYPNGCGTLYSMAPLNDGSGQWMFNLLHTFQGPPTDGRVSKGGVIMDAQGNLYGVSQNGGAQDHGMVWEFSPPAEPGDAWTETTIMSFTTTGCNQPRGRLVMDAAGALYGNCQYGGTSKVGVIFKLTPPATVGGAWTQTTLHTFVGGSDGKYPIGNILMDSGNIYGATNSGGVGGQGIAFVLTPPASGTGEWTETILHSFSGGTDGAAPLGGLIKNTDGLYYGTTNQGGASGYGTVYQLSPPAVSGNSWSYKIIWNFAGRADGNNPVCGLTPDGKGGLYGTTAVYATR